MSPSDRERLEVIIRGLRKLPNRGDSPADRLESAGRLLIAAMDVGAFAEPRFAYFSVMVRQRNEQTRVNGSISAWKEAVLILRARPEKAPRHESDLASEVELVVARMRESLISQERARSGQGSPTIPLAELRAALRPTHFKAYCQREYAQGHCPDLEPEQPGDDAAHRWLTLHGDEEGERLAALDTWNRYLRAVRRALNQSTRR